MLSNGAFLANVLHQPVPAEFLQQSGRWVHPGVDEKETVFRPLPVERGERTIQAPVTGDGHDVIVQAVDQQNGLRRKPREVEDRIGAGGGRSGGEGRGGVPGASSPATKGERHEE